MTHTNNRKVRNLLKFTTSLLLLGALSGCSTTVGSEVRSVLHVDSLGGNYRLVSTSQDSESEVLEVFDGLNRTYTDGFTKITFSSDENLEQTVKEKRMGSLGFNLHSCQSDYGVFAGSVYRLNDANGDLYTIFLPVNLELAIEKYTALFRVDIDKTSLPDDLNDLCIKVSAYRLYGEEIKLSLGSIKSLK